MANLKSDQHGSGGEGDWTLQEAVARIGLLRATRSGIDQSPRAWERLVASCRREAERAVG
jgi:hypothetical protein